jgi:hypothetical protein
VVLTDTEPHSPSTADGSRAADRAGLGLRPVEAVVVVVVVAAGLVMRFWSRSALWLDEALSVDIARLPLGDIPSALRQDGHPPLYYFLLHEWMAAFGQGDNAVRALSGVISILAFPLGWLAGRRVGGPRTGWAFVVLLSLSPFAIRYASETRMYSLLIVLVLAGYLLVANALERSTMLRLVGIAVVTGALLLSHYWAMWLVAATAMVLVWRAWRSEAARGPTVRVLVAMACGGVLFLPWVPSMLYQAAHTGTPWATVARPTTVLTDTVQDFGGGDFAEGVLLGWMLLILFLLGLLATRIDDLRLTLDLRTVPQVRREAAIVALTFAIAIAAGYITQTTYATRYAAVIFPLFLIVAAVGLTRLDTPVVLPIAVGAFVILGFVGGANDVLSDRTQAGEIASAIRADLQPGDVVMTCPDQLGPAMQRVLPASVMQFTYPAFGSPDRVDWRDYEERNARADPAAVADELARRAGTSSAHSVWLVASGAYKTLEGQCEALTAALASRLGNPEFVVAENATDFYEHAALIRFPGPAAP